MQPLFLIGNKRSGTSQLVRVLNLHPQIFVSHESDIAWILQLFHTQQPWRTHPWDSDLGMRVTLQSAGHLLRPEASPRENFTAVQTALMGQGTPWLPPQKKPGLRWLGDKKPMQHTDPELLKFILQHFPDARFLHIVRHPFEVVDSSNRFNQTANGDFWIGLSPEEKLERWTFHEKLVWQFRETHPALIHSLRYEDLCWDTEKTLADAFGFLGLEPDPNALAEAARQTSSSSRHIPAIRFSEETKRIAAAHGYELRAPAGKWKSLARKIFKTAKG